MAPPKSRTNTPESTPARFTRSRSRETAAAARQPARANSSEPRGNTPEATGRTATSYGSGAADMDIGLDELLQGGNFQTIDDMSISFTNKGQPTPNTGNTDSTSDQTQSTLHTSRSKTPARRSRSLTPIDEASELLIANHAEKRRSDQQTQNATGPKAAFRFMDFFRPFFLWFLLPLAALMLVFALMSFATKHSDVIKHTFQHAAADGPHRSMNPPTQMITTNKDKTSNLGNSDKRIQVLEQKVDSVFEILQSMQKDFSTLRNLAKNTELALKKINWFSTSMGAVVDPLKSSPTAERKMGLGAQFYHKVVKRRWAHPPAMALEPWFEPKDCWCAAPPSNLAKGPRAQLAVDLPTPLYPKSITVEHMPAAGTKDWEAAPRQMELWASITDKSVRDQIAQSSESVLGNSQHPEYQRGGRREFDLDSSYVRLGVWTYDVDGSNHVQNFPLGVNAERWGASIRKVVVRAVTNHGGDFTCFYRLRLHGEEVGAPQ